MRRVLLFVSCIAMLAPMGCSARRVTDFTLISTKNTLLTAHADTRGARIEGEDCSMTLFGVPNMKTAIDDALDSAPDKYDALVDGVVWFEDRFFYVCYRVEGTPIRARDPAEIWGPKAVTTESGKVFSPREPEKKDVAPAPAYEERTRPKRIDGEPTPSTEAVPDA